MPEADDSEPVANVDDKRALEAIQRALRGLRFGQVVITVQDNVIVQIERTERTRLRRPSSKG